MGQKVNPIGLRLGVNRTWDSRWFASRGEYARLLHEDLKMREHILTSRKRIARDVKKTLESAIANAENNHDLDVDALIVSEAYVGKKLVMKRLKAGARGRSSRIEKPFAQITVIVRQVEEPA